MSFYTSLTGLNAATASLGVISNNIANVGTTGFKRSRADFGDIFATSPLQKASSVIGQGVALKGVTQEFSQGNLQFSASVLDIAITGDGFFPLKSADGLQDIYTRNGTFLLDDSFSVVNSAGQALMAASVDSQGKADLETLRKLVIPRGTNGDARETTNIELGLNLPADAPVISARFDPRDPNTYNLTTAVTIFDAGGNEYLATVYYVKTQRASPEDPTNKWQTHVLIGDTKLDELLIQASNNRNESMFVNKYGQVRAESQIPPQDIARGVTKLFNLDSLKNTRPSEPAAVIGKDIGQTKVNEMKEGKFRIYDNIIKGAGGQDSAENGIAISLNIDNSPSPLLLDLTDLIEEKNRNQEYSGVELARVLENRINREYGDGRYFNIGELFNPGSGSDDESRGYELMRLTIGSSTPVPLRIRTEELPDDNGIMVIGDVQITLKPGEALVPPGDDGSGGSSSLRPETLVKIIQALLDRDVGTIGEGADVQSRVSVDYSFDKRSFIFRSATSPKEEILVGAFTNQRRNDVFGLGRDSARVDIETGEFGGFSIPNGGTFRPFNSNYSLSDQRTGIRVRFDEESRSFSISSGTTGDTSTVEILRPIKDPTTTPPTLFTAAELNQAITADDLTALVFVPPATPAATERLGAYVNFLKIFGLEPDRVDPVRTNPVRGVRSSPAEVTGNPIGINLDNKFALTAETSVFTVTHDNVTGLIRLPVGQEFTKESFRTALERQINALEDSRGRTVNGAKVEFVSEGTITRLKISTGTEGNDSFLKVTGPSIWGLSDLPVGRGLTERWIAPPQAENIAGVPLYVDRDGNETTDASEFNEEDTRDLWSPVFLDKGELTFTNRGQLESPLRPIGFKPATIEETGATLQFAINYSGTTQFSSPFGVLAQTQNGRPEGDLIGLDIADDGLVTANYSNGSQNNLAKIILSNFTNPQGLRQIGDASYYATSKSGLITFGEPGKAGFGTVRSGARERANVDLTQELIDLITAQRAFQANAKAIETNNTLTQAIINIRS